MYKKYTNKIGIPDSVCHKILLIMRLTTVLLMASLMQVSASTLAQKITLSEKNTALEKVFARIKQQTGYDFVAGAQLLKEARLVNIQIRNVELAKALDQIFEDQPLQFEIQDKMVVIRKKPASYLDQIIARFQAIDVRGKILDEKGEPLVGATVSVKGSGKSVKTNAKGEFYLQNVEEKEKLVISYIGYQTREVNVAADMGSLTMALADAKLEEVMINAGYYTVKDIERTGSISRITAKDIETQPVTSFLATMQGRMAGVDVIQNSGISGGGFRIKIRGQNSLRSDGNNPLYVIDGVPYSSQSIGSSYTSTNMPVQNSPLSSINPDDIESIEVLKDADATAIYGSRGANGVVLITTKKGKAGKTSFALNHNAGFGRVTGFMDLMGTADYLVMRKEAYANDGVSQFPATAYDVNGTWDQTRQTDFQKEFIGGTATYQLLQASVSGGTKLSQYLVSGSYNGETSVFPGDFQSKRANARVNFNHSSEDERFKFTFTGGYVHQNNLTPSTDPTRDSQILAPNAPDLFIENGELNWENGTFSNPAAKLLRTIKGSTYDLIANSTISYRIGAGILAKLDLGYTDLRQNQITFQPSTAFNPNLGRGSEFSSAYYNTVNRNSWIVEPQLSWGKSLGKGKIEILIGSTFQSQQNNQFVSLGTGFLNNSLLENPASATTYRLLQGDQTVYRYSAGFGRVNFNWDGRYILNITGRGDVSSRFGPGKQFAAFGAVGAAWIFTKETFMQRYDFLSSGKLRASFGSSGNDQIGDYQYIDTYSLSGNTYQDVVGLVPSRLFNPDYGWEINNKLEAALELGFFKDRLLLGMNAYRNRSSSQLIGIPLPSTTGFTQIVANLDAEVENRGLELTLNTINMDGRNFKWTSTLNFTSAKNELLSFPNLEGSTYASQFVIGQPLNIIKVYENTGLNTQTGIYNFTDFNKDGNISVVDRQIIKDLNPKFFGGFQNTFFYKGVTLDFLFQFVSQKNFNEMYRFTMPGTLSNQPTGLTQRWRNTGDVGPFQGYSVANSARSTSYARFVQSDAAISDASYIRLKNISVSYELPKKWTGKVHCKIGVQGQNLLTISRYKGLDPEFISSGYLPPLRIISSNLQLSF